MKRMDLIYKKRKEREVIEYGNFMLQKTLKEIYESSERRRIKNEKDNEKVRIYRNIYGGRIVSIINHDDILNDDYMKQFEKTFTAKYLIFKNKLMGVIKSNVWTLGTNKHFTCVYCNSNCVL